MSRPLIAVSGPDRGGLPMWIFSRLAVWRAGGRAVRVTPKRPLPPGMVPQGLILGGGADVGPGARDGEAAELMDGAKKDERPGRSRWLGLIIYAVVYLLRRLLGIQALSGADTDRDELEHRLLDRALQGGLPVLGICRGAQLINVHLGGTLHRDLSSFYTEHGRIRTILARKPVRLAPDSRLAALTATTTLMANALHNQAVNDLGRGLAAVAHEDSGVIQAVEQSDGPLLVGVQWHPEFLPLHRTHQALFRELVRLARGNIPVRTAAAKS